MKYLLVLLLALIAVSCVNSKPIDGAATCSYCKLAVGYAEAFLESSAEETKIADKLDEVCKLIPAEFNSTCVALINANAPEIVTRVLDKDNSTVICDAVKMCTDSVAPIQNEGTAKCSICEFIAQELEQYISGSQSETEIIAEIDKVCSKLGALSSTCQSLVATYVPSLIELLDNDESPATCCAQIKLC